MKKLATALAGSLNKYAVTGNTSKNIRPKVKKKVAVDVTRDGVSDHKNNPDSYLKQE